MYNELKQYFNDANDEEILGFFSVFTEDNRKELSDFFVLVNCALQEKDPENFVEKYFFYRNLIIKSVDSSVLIVELNKLIAANEKAWKEYCGGNEKAIGRFIGQLAKATGITPQDAKAIIEQRKSA